MNEEKEPGSGGRRAEGGAFARLGAEIDNLLRSVIPSDEASQHFSNARLEVLKGVRAIINARIDRLSSEGRKGVSIKIE